VISKIHFSYPTYFLIFCLIAAFLYALSLYWNAPQFKTVKRKVPFWLGLMRFLSIGLIAMLLLMPFLKHLLESQQDPIILIAEDRSQSVQATTDATELASYMSDMNNLEQALSEKYEVKRFSFSEDIKNVAIDSFNGQTTNISKPMKHLQDQYSDLNIGAVIIASDGIYNEGNNPLYMDVKFKAPIHTIALGDTTKRRDLMIKNVLHNRIAYLGDAFNLQVDVQAFNATGSSSKIKIEKIVGGNTTEVKSESFNITSNNYFKTFSYNLDASSVGNVKYRIRLDGIKDELSTSNNSRTMYIEVLDARQKILLLANAPHPDLTAYKSIVEQNKNYEVEIKYAKTPTTNLGSYDIVMLHNLPTRKNPISTELTSLKSKRIPTIFVIGNQVDLPAFNRSQNVVSITGNLNTLNEVQADWDNSFNGYIIDGGLKGLIPKFPPVYAPFGEYKLGAKTEVLLKQRVGKVNTNYPLLAFSEQENWKQTVFAGEGIWKWKIHEYQLMQTDNQMAELINKMVQYTSKKEDKRKFKAYVSKNVIKENEEIVFDAQLYNNNYELINGPDAFITCTDDQKNTYNYTFSKSSNYYTLNVGLLPEGNYKFEAKTNLNGKELKSNGQFSIQSIEKEQYDLTAKHGMLKTLSDRFGGDMFYPSEIPALQDSILNSAFIKPIIYQRNKTESLLNLKWLFLIIGALLILEWFFRRYFGSY